MKISKRELKRIIREEKRKLIKEEQGFVEQAELEDCVYATFCEWMVEGTAGIATMRWTDFEQAVIRRYEAMYGEKVTLRDIQLACEDSM